MNNFSRLVPAALAVLMAEGCARGPAVLTDTTLPLHRVVVYRNGVGYFERRGSITEDQVRFRVLQSEVGDFLSTLTVMERGGSSVRSAAFPMPDEAERPAGQEPNPQGTSGPAVSAAPANPRRTVRLALDGRQHDLVVGYTVETPIWRPSYRLVFTDDHTAQVQAWGIVQNLSGEDWTNVRLSLVSGTPVSFRSELATAVIPTRPIVTDRGAVIDSVPQGDTTLAQDAPGGSPPSPQPSAVTTPSFEASIEESESGPVGGSGRVSRRAAPRPRFAGASGGSGASADDLAGAPTSESRGYRERSMRPPPPPMSSAPRNLNALAALAVQGGSTRYDLPNAVTIPDRSATMVLLTSMDVPGQQMYLFAPDPGVGDSARHPFHVARFENRTGALLERGPLAIFESGAFLGQGMLDVLPDAATTTIPFALERAVAVESSSTHAVEGARLVRIAREQVTIERFNLTRTTYRLRNGMDHNVRVMVRHALNGAELVEPPQGTETNIPNALVPVEVPTRNRSEQVVTMRTPFASTTVWGDERAIEAIEAYLRTANPPAAIAAPIRSALDLQRQVNDLTRDRGGVDERRSDLQTSAEETRENLLAIQRNALAQDLRSQLTSRLGRIATELDQLTRRIVELDTQISERRVRFVETVRGIELDTTRPTPANAPLTPLTPVTPAAPVTPATPPVRPR